LLKNSTSKVIRLTSVISITLVNLYSCTAQKKSHQEFIILTSSFYEPSQKKYVIDQKYAPDHKIWYKDSMVIQEIPGLHLYDSTGSENRWVDTQWYTFIDLRTKTFYDYQSFSDTARLIKEYTQADSVPVVGGWNFYIQRDLPGQKPVIYLSDTTIESIIYKRIKLEEDKGNTTIGYLRCDKKKSVFRFDNALSKNLGCPIVRMDLIPKEGLVYGSFSSSIVFVKDTLSAYEIRVFNAWEIKAKKNY
jgi:hypothetical protein